MMGVIKYSGDLLNKIDRAANKISQNSGEPSSKSDITGTLSTLIMALMTLRDIANSKKLSAIITKLTMLQSLICVINMAAAAYLRLRPATPKKQQASDLASDALDALGYLPYELVCHRHGDDTDPEDRDLLQQIAWSRVPASNFIDAPGFFTFVLNSTDILKIISLRDDKMEDATSMLIEDIATAKIYTPILVVFSLKGHSDKIYAIKSKPFSDEVQGLAIDIDPVTGISQTYAPLNVSTEAFRLLHTEFTSSLKGKAVRISAGEYYQSLQMSAVPMINPEFYNKKIKARLVDLISRACLMSESVTVFLYGYPGVGKTSAIASALIDLGLMPMYIDSSLQYKSVSHLVTLDNKDRILVLEELTALTGDDPEDMNDRMATILKILESRVFRAVIMTSNTTKVNAALSRSGRADIKILCEKPDSEERKDICEGLSKKYGIFYDDGFIKASNGATHADLHSVFRYAKIEGRDIYDILKEHREADALFKKFNPDESESESESEFTYD